ncbi:MAG: cobalamin-dependent protein [Candidatus Promineifilaceae bacterium]|nr:cobalamin-dependent protein [Candidatus Promineifilaceae bacterium]
MEELQQLINAITDMREEESVHITHQLLETGASPFEVLDACREAMDIIGHRFEVGDCFIPELIVAGEIMSQIAAVVKPRIQQEGEREKLGKIVFGTVQGDIHDIGKDIVVFMLDINGFEVIDLGVDVPAARFVEAVQETGAPIAGLSGFLTVAYDPMKDTIYSLRQAAPDVRIMVGGGPVDAHVCDYTGADAYGRDAMAAVQLAKKWVGAS